METDVRAPHDYGATPHDAVHLALPGRDDMLPVPDPSLQQDPPSLVRPRTSTAKIHGCRQLTKDHASSFLAQPFLSYLETNRFEIKTAAELEEKRTCQKNCVRFQT